MKKNLHYFFSVVVVALFFSINTYAQDIPDTLSTSYGEGADAHVSNDDKNGPDENFGTGTYLIVRNHEVRQRIIYLKFDITDNPRFNLANQAYIGLNVKYAEKMADLTLDVSVYGMIDDVEDEWVDSLLTYTDGPGLEEADLNDYELDDGMVEYLTTITISKDTVGWVYSEPTVEMDEFINADKNDLLTFILLVEVPNTGDEVRIYTEEDIAVNKPPILHGEEPIAAYVESISLSSFNLEQNFPNPYNGTTTLTYNLNEPKHVELTIYNTLGTKVAALVNEFQKTGEYNVDVDMDRLQLSPGIYYTKINVGSYSQTIKMINCK